MDFDGILSPKVRQTLLPYLHWNSLSISHYNINLINCLSDCNWTLFSNLKLFHQEIQRIKLILLKNDYPMTVLNTTFKKCPGKRFIIVSRNNG